MAIKPSDLMHKLNLPQQESRRTQIAGQQRIGFADVLSTIAQKNSTDYGALAELCRLTVLSSSVSLADDSAFEKSFPSPLASLDAYVAAASQKTGLAPAALTTVAREKNSPPRTEMTDIAERAAERYGVSPALVKAVIKAESNFNPTVVSHAGAQGLMQLMPGTAQDLGVSDPFDAEQNVMGGTRYLKQLLGKYDGDLDKTLAAYNWGMGNVDRKGIDVLPEETRNYLSRVKRYQSEFLA
ncbi:MAG: lytic transglycosylase domain-containing protein [Trichloromonas sp.]|jgi:soluble lytic murein transglycosylase-like protein|nr:lytic transglycosylase domain-containing protein [Trichloromonas sp.]